MQKLIDKNQLFVNHPENYIEICNKDFLLQELASVDEIENGIILPLRKTNETKLFEGGVYKSNGDFAAGHIKGLDNLNSFNSCSQAYQISSPPDYKR